MAFFDTHTHLDYLAYETNEPISLLVENARKAQVEKILIVAVMAEQFKNLEKITALFPNQLCYGLGLHPLYIQQHQQDHLVLLEKLLNEKNERLVAIGEIGLERAIPELLTDELWKKQCDFFEAQLSLAQQYHLPVNIHNRKSQDQIFPFLKRIQLDKCGVIHGFSGSYEQAKRFVDLGYKIGVGGVITYARANKTRNTIQRLPLDSLLLETDTPDMPVFGFQGQPNRPERIAEIFTALCELRDETPERISETIWETSCSLFS
ncbi:TatD DNase family protein [Bisgaardia hudsonensis]|uniref:TatD DNase family protein n=1 Tax=Bisgaardia hudsonensis TaxID=109472 RepID=A0A4V6NQ93_9PAST|nr:TatD family hydrolase [Bisgaardia hudsonensis]QLB12453.1 deoxyribonuclease [Bisgaardia hudsonensis]TCP13990.1 TatD DNase family protein [Bisgaardia hudsonensis]